MAARTITFPGGDDLGPVTLPADVAADLFERAMGNLDPSGRTGICGAFSDMVGRVAYIEAPTLPDKLINALMAIDEDPYSYLGSLPAFLDLAPDSCADGDAYYWFDRGVYGPRDNFGNRERLRDLTPAEKRANYRHRLTALAFLATFAREGY